MTPFTVSLLALLMCGGGSLTFMRSDSVTIFFQLIHRERRRLKIGTMHLARRICNARNRSTRIAGEVGANGSECIARVVRQPRVVWIGFFWHDTSTRE